MFYVIFDSDFFLFGEGKEGLYEAAFKHQLFLYWEYEKKASFFVFECAVDEIVLLDVSGELIRTEFSAEGKVKLVLELTALPPAELRVPELILHDVFQEVAEEVNRPFVEVIIGVLQRMHVHSFLQFHEAGIC